LLSEGKLFVSANISTINPHHVHVRAREAVAFQVVDPMEGDSARGQYAEPMPGVVRPLLRWSTTVNGNGRKTYALTSTDRRR
jgi:lipopolysaccharide transport system ATP-binding protein